MDGLLYWITDHPIPVIAVALIVFAVLTALAGRAVWRRIRRLERRPGPWFAFGATLVGLLVAGVGLFYFTTAAVAIGPGLLQQQALRGEPAPELAYLGVADGAQGNLADLRGKVVLVNFWATWCPPCRTEMPDLERLQQKYRDQGLVVLQISDEPRETIAAYLEEQPMSTEHGYVRNLPWPDTGRPTTYIVDREGVVRTSILGSRKLEHFEDLVGKYL